MNFIELLMRTTIILTTFTIILVWFTRFNIYEFEKNCSLRTYLLLIFSLASLVTTGSFFIRGIFNASKEIFFGEISYLNNYLYLALTVTFLTLTCGYFYIKNSKEEKLKKFCIVISISLLNIFAAVSALKSILRIN
jgi:hypothetical protein